MEAGGGELESYFKSQSWDVGCSTPGIRIDKCDGSLFDDCLCVRPVSPFIDMEREVVIIYEMRKEHHKTSETGDCNQENSCSISEIQKLYLG